MFMLNFKAPLYLFNIVFILFCCLKWNVKASTGLIDMIHDGTRAGRITTANAGFKLIQERAAKGDNIAKQFLSTMPSSDIPQKEGIINAYNVKIKERIDTQKLAEAAGLDKEKHPDHDSLVVSLRQEQLAFTDLVSSSSGDGAMVTTGSSSLRLQSGGLDIVVRASGGPIRPRLMQLLREYAEKISQLEKASGQQQFSEVLGGKPIGSSGNLTLDLMLGSYYQAISDIAKQSQALVSIQKAFYEMQSLYRNALDLRKKTVKITTGYKNKQREEEVFVIEDQDLDALLLIMQSANELVKPYKATKFAGIENRIRTAKSKEARVDVIRSIFDDLYVTPLSDELARLSNSEHLQQSLTLTKVFEKTMAGLQATKAYPESDFTQMTGVLSAAASKFANQIRENNRRLYEEYEPVLRAQLAFLGQKDAGYFASQPMILSLLLEPAAFFMLAKPSDNVKVLPFGNIERIARELGCLELNQLKAVFAYLYFISDQFRDISGRYLGETLLTLTPITVADVDGLVELSRQAIKTNASPSEFVPSASDQGSLRQFAEGVISFKSGNTRKKAIRDKLQSERDLLRKALVGITPEQLMAFKGSQISAATSSVIERMLGCIDLLKEEDASVAHADEALLVHITTLKDLRLDLDKSENRSLPDAVRSLSKKDASVDSGAPTVSLRRATGNIQNMATSMGSVIMSGTLKQLTEKGKGVADLSVPSPPPAPLFDMTFVPPPPPPPSFDDASSSVTTVVVSPFVAEKEKFLAEKEKFLSGIAELEQQLKDKESIIADYAEAMENLLSIKEKAKEAGRERDLVQCALRLSPIKRQVKPAK